MKKKILIIIALIMIISTIIRTAVISFSFLNFSNQLIQNQTLLIKEILEETNDKEKFLQIIKNSHHINDIKFIPDQKTENIKIEYNFKTQTIISVAPFDDNGVLQITFSGVDYFSKLQSAILQLIAIAIISLIIIILIVNYYLTPYLEILEKIKQSTEEILKGNFNQKIETKLKGEAKEFVDSYNNFLNKMKNSFGVIEEKYTTLIEKEKSNDPLNDAKETIEQLANIFQFKRLIEDDATSNNILNRLIDIIKGFNINHFALVGIDNSERNSFLIYSQGDICCNILENFEGCRAYRLNKEINSLKFKKICEFHICKNEYICLPFSSGGNFTGILKIMTDKEKDQEILQKNLPYIKAYLNEVSAVIEAKYTLEILHNQTIKDPLTGLFNRRYLENILPTLIAAAHRRGEKIAFLMIDMDYFKKINDSYGHEAGDIVLKTLSNILKYSIRKSDIAIRYGGEEFLIILQNIKSIDDAVKVAEKIRENVQNTVIDIGEKGIKKTVSIGVSIFPDQCLKGWECIKCADIALYEAKRTGRNKVILFNKKLKQEANYNG
ncbi:MAG: GGDEF domain-containing protein [Nautiliaceae bacterium]